MFELEHYKLYLYKRKSMYLRSCGSFKSAKKIRSANYKSVIHNKDWVPSAAGPRLQTCGFAICGTYLRVFADEEQKLKKMDCD
jgi:hypothetical protein